MPILAPRGGRGGAPPLRRGFAARGEPHPPTPPREEQGAENPAEFMLLPNAPYDHQVDSTAGALAWTEQCPTAHGMLEGWRKTRRDRVRAEPAANRGIPTARSSS